MLSVSPAVTPQAQFPLWPTTMAGVPGRAAPATVQPGDFDFDLIDFELRAFRRARYQCGGAVAARWGSLASKGRPDPGSAA